MKIELPAEENNTLPINQEKDTSVNIEFVHDEQENKKNVENTEEVENVEETNQQMQEDSQSSQGEEDIQQKQVDEKIKKQLEEINSQFLQILEKIQIHQNILQELNDASDQEKLKQKDQLKFNKKSFQENEIKLEKLLLALDSLVGASEELRPQKKSAVVEIQKVINKIESSILPQIKKLEETIEELQKKSSLPPKEEAEMVETQASDTVESNEDDVESNEENVQEESNNKDTPQQKVEEEKEMVEEEEEEEESFPFPSKKEWEMLTFEPKFNVQQHPTKYLLFSKIPGLKNEDIKIKTSDNVLSIEAVRYPSEQEKNLLIKKLFETVRNPHVLRRLSRKQIVSAILRIASEYNFGKFSVKYELPHNFDASSGVNAVYNNGVLQVELPIKMKTQQRYPFEQNNFYRPEVPLYGQRSRRPNNFWDFF